MLKIGIVFPRSVFKYRDYQKILRMSISEIAQENCLHEEEEDGESDDDSLFGQEKSPEHENETRLK